MSIKHIICTNNEIVSLAITENYIHTTAETIIQSRIYHDAMFHAFHGGIQRHLDTWTRFS